MRAVIIGTGLGLCFGLGAGYWLGQNSVASEATTTASTFEASAINSSARTNIQATTATSVTPSTADTGPTGLRLVGTIVDANRKKSKGWLQEITTEATQAFAEGDSITGGYLIEAIGADMLTASKDGHQYVIRRSSTPSAASTANSAPDTGYSRSAEREAARTGRDFVERPSAVRGRNPQEQTLKSGSHREQGVRPMSAKGLAGWKDADQSENASDDAEPEEPAAKDSE
ncbi:hypothetical protein CJD38_12790 [Stenotrophobium rhamnosiphilum]|uniref:Uncharacterized protein n=2 Tax=Stenotrophobium rhamnosiphilum TaxID=2029166 RepID=A0A2T5MF04_9GAMM|nr:hypothetical protein CJD38_12790 [Stenotrophobium rhamnosiphilum]